MSEAGLCPSCSYADGHHRFDCWHIGVDMARPGSDRTVKVATPLNGTKTHPLSEHARGVLQSLYKKSTPTMEVNPGVIDRLTREGLAAVMQLTSPYAKHKGGKCNHLVITQAGIEALS